jgi:hypothetical protein
VTVADIQRIVREERAGVVLPPPVPEIPRVGRGGVPRAFSGVSRVRLGDCWA